MATARLKERKIREGLSTRRMKQLGGTDDGDLISKVFMDGDSFSTIHGGMIERYGKFMYISRSS